MKTYRVVWEIDLDGDTPEEVARAALEIQRDPESFATVFGVRESVGGEPVGPLTIVDVN